ncbi:hypothetical protein Shyd_52360 [Streptomyces hydrogenans]|uniref:Uncharacterized protein n=1 Tax=Streptomyces hydrogenans TaxID=1873719 RepID=A0ABQ3PFQ7_9ACTN|nr:hypothetical protein GCM10018784_40290 [Streptomyces hydrogenans]GHI23865.1 hypothetical protein Shyd_52360 [Streptomyces hydrogenans]
MVVVAVGSGSSDEAGSTESEEAEEDGGEATVGDASPRSMPTTRLATMPSRGRAIPATHHAHRGCSDRGGPGGGGGGGEYRGDGEEGGCCGGGGGAAPT